MEKLIKTLTLIAYTPDSQLHRLPLVHRSLIPLLTMASSLYRISLFLRRKFFLRQQQRLPVPVISVGNLTWGGNGKTPMTEFIVLTMAEFGILPLVLTRGYAGGDEANMLRRHLSHASVRIGVGANRGAIAASMLSRYGHMDSSLTFHKLSRPYRSEPGQENEKVGVVILDDGMQHRTLFRDVEIVMLNSLLPWGNNHLLPRGSLREPLSALERADIVIIHHADLVSDAQLKDLDSKLPLTRINNIVVLCVSGIGFPDAFVRAMKKIGPLHVGRLDFSDHHRIQSDDIDLIRERVEELQILFKTKAIVVVTEKDYDRDPYILKKQGDLTILVLCSSIQFIPVDDHTEEDFIMKLNWLLINNYQRRG